MELGFGCPSGVSAAPLAVTVHSCRSIGADQLGERILIELTGRSLGEATIVSVTCSGVSIRVCVGSGRLCRELPRDLLPRRLGASILAVTAAELLEDLRGEQLAAARPPAKLATEPPAAVVPPASAVSTGAPRTEGRLPIRFGLKAVAAWQGATDSMPALWGGGLELTADHRLRLGFSLDLLSRRGEARFSLGTISVLTLGVGAFGHVHHTLSRLVLRASAGLRVGAVALYGDASDPQIAEARALWAPWAAGVGKLSAGVFLPKRILVEVTAEGGYTLHGVLGRADGEVAIKFAGALAGVHLGIGVVF